MRGRSLRAPSGFRPRPLRTLRDLAAALRRRPGEGVDPAGGGGRVLGGGDRLGAPGSHAQGNSPGPPAERPAGPDLPLPRPPPPTAVRRLRGVVSRPGTVKRSRSRASVRPLRASRRGGRASARGRSRSPPEPDHRAPDTRGAKGVVTLPRPRPCRTRPTPAPGLGPHRREGRRPGQWRASQFPVTTLEGAQLGGPPSPRGGEGGDTRPGPNALGRPSPVVLRARHAGAPSRLLPERRLTAPRPTSDRIREPPSAYTGPIRVPCTHRGTIPGRHSHGGPAASDGPALLTPPLPVRDLSQRRVVPKGRPGVEGLGTAVGRAKSPAWPEGAPGSRPTPPPAPEPLGSGVAGPGRAGEFV